MTDLSKNAGNEEFVYGRNAVLAFLEQSEREGEGAGGRQRINKVLIADGLEPDKRLDRIRKLAQTARLPVMSCDRRKLDQMLGRDSRHQGVALMLSATELVELSDFLADLLKGDEPLKDNPVVVIADGIEDPHNLGAMIRVAEAAGARALLVPPRRSAQVTGTVSKVSAGALAALPIVRIHNLVRALEELKEAGFWIVGLDVRGQQSCFEADLMRPLALVVGSEQKGMSRLVAENCDFHVKIPMLGKTQSLNASVALGVVLFEVVRQKLAAKRR
ncbi:MAG TPA: 23S rRNA (guanosine(2251)-2'-O)-methyltransferase RlmB [Candidatus Obscuribacterales bacterium]